MALVSVEHHLVHTSTYPILSSCFPPSLVFAGLNEALLWLWPVCRPREHCLTTLPTSCNKCSTNTVVCFCLCKLINLQRAADGKISFFFLSKNSENSPPLESWWWVLSTLKDSSCTSTSRKKIDSMLWELISTFSINKCHFKNLDAVFYSFKMNNWDYSRKSKSTPNHLGSSFASMN